MGGSYGYGFRVSSVASQVIFFSSSNCADLRHVLFHGLDLFSSFATHGLNFTQTQGAALQSILSAGRMFGPHSGGTSLMYAPYQSQCHLLSHLRISTLCIWAACKKLWRAGLSATVQRMTGGTIWSTAMPVMAKIVGAKDLACALSIFWLSLVIPALVGQPIAIA